MQGLELDGVSSGDGVRFAAVLAVAASAPDESQASAARSTLALHGVTEATVLLAATTDFGSRVAEAEPSAPVDLVARCANTVALAAAVSWPGLLERHVRFHAARFGTFALRLGSPSARRPVDGFRSDLPTDERLRASRTAVREDYGLLEQAVQLGRYLLLASSSPHSQLPANLQGVWAEDMHPPWGSDFHLNINLQQMYWPSGPLGLADTLAPLAPFLERLARSGAQVARRLYGANASGAWMANESRAPQP